MAQITLSLEEYEEIKRAKALAEQEFADISKAMIDLRMNSDGGVMALHGLCSLTRKALSVACFAVANLPPETTRGWPTKTLRELAALIPILPDYTVNDHDLMNELVAFAIEAEAQDQRRRSAPQLVDSL